MAQALLQADARQLADEEGERRGKRKTSKKKSLLLWKSLFFSEESFLLCTEAIALGLAAQRCRASRDFALQRGACAESPWPDASAPLRSTWAGRGREAAKMFQGAPIGITKGIQRNLLKTAK